MKILPELSPTEENLSTFIGQEEIKRDLREIITQVKRQREVMLHLLLCAPPEMGKSRLVRAIANELVVPIKILNPGVTISIPDFTGVLTHIDQGEILFVQNIEHIKQPVLPMLISALKDGYVDIQILDQLCRVDLPSFSLIGTTNKPSKVSKRLRKLMKEYHFVPYERSNITQIVRLHGKNQGLVFESQAANIVANECEGLPGHAVLLVNRISNYCRVFSHDRVTVEFVVEALESIGKIERGKTALEIANGLRQMNGEEFEEFIAKLFRKLGYIVEIMGGTGDGGIDLVMKRANEEVVVQCKCWDDSVGEPVVRDFYGALIDAQATFGCIVASSSFTSHALDFAEGKPIRLIDLATLVEFLKRSHIDIEEY